MSLLNESTTRFFDEWESIPEEIRKEVISKRLDEYVRYASDNVPFYRSRLRGYDKGASSPLSKVPVLNSGQLRELLPPKSSELLATKETNYSVFQSGGTTGEPKTTLFSHEELDGLTLPNARGFFALGLGKNDRVGNLFAVGQLYMTFVHTNRMIQQYGCMNFPFSNNTPIDFVQSCARLFKINCFAGITSSVLNCLRGMANLGLDGITIEKIFYGGEHIYAADIRDIKEKFGAKVIAAPGYGTVDTWYIGYQCAFCPTGVFHAHDDQCYIEIVNEDSGSPCNPEEIGMIYATPFVRKLTPIVRYRVGDRAKWVDSPCECGRTTPLFRLLGRGDDVLRIGYDSVDYNYIQTAVSKIDKLLGAVQIEKKRENGRDKLIIRVETEASYELFSAITLDLEKEILRNRPSLKKFVSEKTVCPLQIELLKPGSIPRNPRTGKLVRVIDSISEK